MAVREVHRDGAGGISRRGLLVGALTGAGATAAIRPGAAAGAIAAEAKVVRRGRAIAVSPTGRRIVVAHERRRTIAVGSRLVNVGGEPLEVAISPDGRTAAVTTAFWDAPGLVLVDLASAEVRKRLEVGPAPGGLAFCGGRLVVTGGEQEGGVWLVDPRRRKVLAHRPIGRCPRAAVAAPGRDAVWIALQADDAVVRVSARSGRVQRTLRTPPHPDRLAVSPDGRRLLVTHGGLEAERVSEIDVATRRVVRHRVGALPSAVAYTRGGKRLVALSGEIVTIGGRRQPVGGAPRGLAVAGRRAYTVDGLTGEIAQVRL